MLYSAHKNKKAPAYMLKSILTSLDKINFDRAREDYKKKALDVLKLLKPNCYEVMIEIFKLQQEIEFFTELAELKLEQEIYRDVVFIASLFPEVLNNLESLK